MDEEVSGEEREGQASIATFPVLLPAPSQIPVEDRARMAGDASVAGWGSRGEGRAAREVGSDAGFLLALC